LADNKRVAQQKARLYIKSVPRGALFFIMGGGRDIKEFRELRNLRSIRKLEKMAADAK
jgi:hypothetical protein